VIRTGETVHICDKIREDRREIHNLRFYQKGMRSSRTCVSGHLDLHQSRIWSPRKLSQPYLVNVTRASDSQTSARLWNLTRILDFRLNQKLLTRRNFQTQSPLASQTRSILVLKAFKLLYTVLSCTELY